MTPSLPLGKWNFGKKTELLPGTWFVNGGQTGLEFRPSETKLAVLFLSLGMQSGCLVPRLTRPIGKHHISALLSNH